MEYEVNGDLITIIASIVMTVGNSIFYLEFPPPSAANRKPPWRGCRASMLPARWLPQHGSKIDFQLFGFIVPLK